MPIKDLLKSCEELLEDDFVNEPEELESNVGGGGAHCRDGNRHSDTSGLTDVSYVGAANPPLQHQGSSPQHQVPIEIDSMQGKRPRAFTDSDANAVSRSLASSESPAVEGTSSKRSAFRVVTRAHHASVRLPTKSRKCYRCRSGCSFISRVPLRPSPSLLMRLGIISLARASSTLLPVAVPPRQHPRNDVRLSVVATVTTTTTPTVTTEATLRRLRIF
jgi:hypothetical protein